MSPVDSLCLCGLDNASVCVKIWSSVVSRFLLAHWICGRYADQVMDIEIYLQHPIFADESSDLIARSAPPERASRQEIQASLEALNSEPLLKALLDAVGAYLLLLDSNRQILFASHDFLKTLGFSETLVGFRPGEALNCIHAWDSPAGCGTAEACSTCGEILAFLQSRQTGRPAERECLIRIRRGELEDAREFRVKASPMNVRGEACTLVSLTDISSEKRREALERLFFHDILNTVQGLVGWTRILGQGKEEDRAAAAKRLISLTESLGREIEDHRALLMAEKGVLNLSLAEVRIGSILEVLEGIFAGHEVSRGKHLDLARTNGGEKTLTDGSLVTRVLTNMVTNAFEATPAGGTVRLWTRGDADSLEFCVWNEGVIPKSTALQIFCRSFSTKEGSGRGIGTFSMKLFGERYLGGKVRFTSTDSGGTIFSLSLPRQAPKKQMQTGSQD